MTMDAASGDGMRLSRPLTHRDILSISLPIILSNVTTPLVGLVDTAVIGQSGSAALMGGVAIGATLFSMLFWAFGFLRMGTSGLTAQSYGAGDRAEVAACLQRAIIIALVMGVVIVLLRGPVGALSLWLLGGTPEVRAAAHRYYEIRVWCAPVTLVNYAILGWFVGLGLAGRAFVIQILLNAVNMGLCILFVLSLGYGVAGAAWATVLAETVSAAAGLLLAYQQLRRTGGLADLQQTLQRSQLAKALSIGGNIMVRTLCLMFAFSFFTAQGARMGDVVLAANALLFDLFSVAAYFLDGFSHAAETFVGQAIGARRRERLIEAVRLSGLWSAALSVVAGAGLMLSGAALIDLMTKSVDVREAARSFLPWTALSPVLGCVAFLFDGVFIGATRGADMRNMMIVSLVCYLAAVFLLVPHYGNHGLWAALMVFFAVRGATLGARYPALVREAFP